MVRRKVKLKITTASRQTLGLCAMVLRLDCPVCKREVEMLTRAQAAGILEVDAQAFDLLLAGGRMHTIQTVSGSIRVCKNSLFANRE